MSLAEVRDYSEPSRPDRLPPQDVTAEQCVLGSMLMSKDAIADVIEQVRGTDFYRPAHELIYDAVLDLYGRGEPADAITVADELTKRGAIQRVGGHPYLHDLLATVPVAANAGYYADIVREKAILRRLVDASVKIAQMGYSAEGDVDEIVDAAQAEVYGVTDRRASEDYKPLSALMEATLDEIEAIESHGGAMSGVPTGFAELDDLTNGLHGGQMIIVAARPAMGKALALDTVLPTPTGWTTMGDVVVGDELIDAAGRATTVVAATEVMHGRPCFEITFSDGTSVVADAEHQWRATSRAAGDQIVSHPFERGAIDRVVDAAVAASDEPDRLVTLKEIVAEVGQEFRHMLHSVAQEIGTSEQELRLVAGEQRSHDGPAPAYSRQKLLLTLGVRASRPRGAQPAVEDPQVVTTAEMAACVRLDGGRSNWAVEKAEAVVGAEQDLSLPPYALGVWLGDGHGDRARFTSADPEVAALVIASGVGISKQSGLDYDMVDATSLLGNIGVLGDKHIPASYLRASIGQRRELLSGLLDTDGTVHSTGAIEFVVTNQRLAMDTYELVVSLGYWCGITTRQVAGPTESTSTAYVLNFTTDDPVFNLQRKKDEHVEHRRPRSASMTQRYVTEITSIDSVPVRCVEVDNPDHLYLATRAMIPTHNSTLGLDFARAASIKHGLCSAIFSLEMGQTEITMRLLSAEAEIPLNHIRKGQMTEEDWTRLSRKMGQVSEAPLFIDDSPNLTMMEIRAKARRLKQRHDLKLVIIDYMQLMTSGKKVESRQLEVSEFSRQIKLLAKELHIPVVALSQLNRGPEQRTDKKPMVADLRESGSLEQDADMIILLHREDYYDKESPRLGEADLMVAKHRNGPTRDIPVVFQGHYSRFRDMQH